MKILYSGPVRHSNGYLTFAASLLQLQHEAHWPRDYFLVYKGRRVWASSQQRMGRPGARGLSQAHLDPLTDIRSVVAGQTLRLVPRRSEARIIYCLCSFFDMTDWLWKGRWATLWFTDCTYGVSRGWPNGMTFFKETALSPHAEKRRMLLSLHFIEETH